MKIISFESMSIDELWMLREEIGVKLAAKLETEKRELEALLDKLQHREFTRSPVVTKRRAYPKVQPKFHNPHKLSQTWAGRGRTPRWVSELLATGATLEDLRISKPEMVTAGSS